ncbi:MAG: PD-(D/E)XK nuclease family protein, partial [bacterium]
ALGESVRLPAAVIGEEVGRKPLPAGELRRLPSDFEMPVVPMAVEWSVVEVGREEDVEFSWVGETARHVGTVVHKWLQRMAEDELRGWTEERIRSLGPRFSDELQRRGVQPSEIKRAAGLVLEALSNTIADERGRWLLGPHAESWSEYRFRTADGKRLVADRRIREASGEQWVVDYKTSRHEGAEVEVFLDREKERYAPQLKQYSEKLEYARMGLYFPLLGGWRELGGNGEGD